MALSLRVMKYRLVLWRCKKTITFHSKITYVPNELLPSGNDDYMKIIPGVDLSQTLFDRQVKVQIVP